METEEKEDVKEFGRKLFTLLSVLVFFSPPFITQGLTLGN